MGGKLIDGRKLAKAILDDVKRGVEQLQRKPKLAVILVGSRKDSEMYVRMKTKRATSVGIEVVLQRFEDPTVNEADVIKTIRQWNADDSVDGIMIQLPLPDSLDEQRIVEQIDPNKDVDGLHPLNLAGIAINKREPKFVCCTPKACLRILDEVCNDLAGKLAVVIGRSNIVGLPITWLLQNRNATVISCDKFTKGTKTWAQMADIVVSATGVPHLVNRSWVKSGAIVVDIGITKTTQGKIVGDVNTEDVIKKVAYVTPVPGGVGPVTIAMLMENVFLSAHENQIKKCQR